jgi:hypothetical protein
MSAPGSEFIDEWRAQIADAMDGSWSAHSCFLADDLARAHPDMVHVEAERTFHPFPPTPTGLRRLLVDLEDDLSGIASVHLAAHLWWEDDRRDFLAEVNARVIDESWIRAGGATYARAASRFLPDHGYF